MDILRLAWRNLWRNHTRTLISAMAISLSFAALLVTFGLADSTYEQMYVGAVKTAGGSVVVHAEGWNATRAGDLLIRDPEAVAAAARQLPGVRFVLPRMVVQGLLSSSRGAEPIELSGIDPKLYAELLDLAPFVGQGAFVSADQARPLVISDELAKKLVVGVGGKVVVTATDPQGEMTRALFRVTGILRPRTGLPDGAAFTSLQAAADVVNAGQARTELGLLLEDDEQRAQTAAALRRAVESGGQRLEVLTWDQALPDLLGAIQADKAFAWLMGLAVFVVMGFGIANTLLMSVLERTRELGLLSALGFTPARTAWLVLAESATLTAVSVALGYGLALLAHLYLRRYGIDLSGYTDVEMEWSGVLVQDLRLHSTLDASRWLLGGLGVVAIVVASAIYPALRASRLDPVQAMRTYE